MSDPEFYNRLQAQSQAAIDLHVRGADLEAIPALAAAAEALAAAGLAKHSAYYMVQARWASALMRTRSFAEATQKYQIALPGFDQCGAQKDAFYEFCHREQADCLRVLGRFKESIFHYGIADEIRTRLNLPEDGLDATRLYSHADSLFYAGHFREALPLYQNADRIWESRGQSPDLSYTHAMCRMRIGQTLCNLLAFVDALPFFKRAREMFWNLRQHRIRMMCLRFSADAFLALGAPAEALSHARDAVELGDDLPDEEEIRHLPTMPGTLTFGKWLVDEDETRAGCRIVMAKSLAMLGELSEAAEQLKSAAAVYRESDLRNRPDYASCMEWLSDVEFWLGHWPEALAALVEAATVAMDNQSDAHPVHAAILRRTAACCEQLGMPERAAGFLLEAMRREDRIGREILPIMGPAERMAWLRSASCDALLTLAAREKKSPGLAGGGESSAGKIPAAAPRIELLKEQYAVPQTSATQAELPERIYDTVLRRKGLAMEAASLARQRASNLLPGPIKQVVEQLRAIDHAAAALKRDGPGRSAPEETRLEHHAKITAAETRAAYVRRKLDAATLSLVEFEDSLMRIGWQDVKKLLPDGACLIEFVQYAGDNFAVRREIGPDADKAGRYAVFVLTDRPDAGLFFADLGPVKPINDLVQELRHLHGECDDLFRLRTLREYHLSHGTLPAEAELDQARAIRVRQIERAGASLLAHLWQPLLGAIGQATHLFIAPDGELNHFPFELLPVPPGGHLCDHADITYLSTGRDLVRWQRSRPALPRAGAILAGPDFELAGQKAWGLRLRDRDPIAWGLDLKPGNITPLPGALEEGARVAEFLGVSPLTGPRCLKEDFLKLENPVVLHLATHGFFIPYAQIPAVILPEDWDTEKPLIRLSAQPDPLQRAGLLLAGAKAFIENGLLRPGAGNGIVTAREITGVNLEGTELVVSSACHSSAGEVRAGEGVMGFRHAFILAGARAVLMPWWSVHDLASVIFMDKFYSVLLRPDGGASRHAALRAAREHLRAITAAEVREFWLPKVGNVPLSAEFKHRLQTEDAWRPFKEPHFWATFFLHGDPGPLSAEALAEII